jgi:hypothetical protein
LNTKSLSTLAALIVIGTGGFMAGRISSPDHPAGTHNDASVRKPSRTSGVSADASRATGRASQRPARPARDTAESSADRQARLTSIMRGENPLERNRALLTWIDQLGPNDFESAISEFRALGITESRMGEYALLLSAWAKTDPLAALDYAKANTGGRFASSTILSCWAAADPEAAIRWAQANHEGESPNPYLAGIIRGLAGSDPARATELLTNMPLSHERGEALAAFMPQLLTQGADATRSWISKLTDDSLRDAAISSAANALAASDPAGTVAWLAANPSQTTQRRMDDVYSVWAGKDPQGALSSISTLASEENRSNALRGIVANVAMSDPKSALAMMNRYPNDVNDRVVQQFVWHSLGNDPATAVSQITRIADEGQRNQMYQHTVGTWLERDPAAASAWMQSHPLPQAVQDQLNRPR